MRLRPAAALLALVLLASGCTRPEAGPDAGALARDAARFLWAQQGEDGGWRSETHGVLRSGQALTPFVLDALLDVPEALAPRPEGGVERALAFLRRHVDEEGALGRADPDVLEYPTYATAYAIRCLVEAGRPSDRRLVIRMRTWLERTQLAEARGFEPADFAYGGWGFGGAHPPGVPGHMDLAHTRRALEALRAAGSQEAEGLRRARSFLALLQKRPGLDQPVVAESERMEVPVPGELDPHDGGFYFSPVVLPANKGRATATHYRSYATATCDGLLALLAAGVPADDERVVAARRWLERHDRLDLPAGIPEDHPTRWAPAVRLYHLAVRAEVARALGRADGLRERIARALRPLRRADGGFENPHALMKEDDPLLATALALVALR